MKNKVRISFVTLIIIFLGFNVTTLWAQEAYTDTQKDVWKNVNDYWALFAKGDIKGYLDYMHADYLGWDNDDILPATKTEAEKYLNYFFQGNKIPFFDIKPLAIRVYGDVAFVHYIFYFVIESKDGKKTDSKGRWTDILLKHGDKWVMVGDHGGEDNQE
jgi:ketosteroid isomerase-like protein